MSVLAGTDHFRELEERYGGAIFLGVLIYNLFKNGKSGWAWALIAALAVLIFFLLRTAAAGGSGGGFGGGSSGGGGATGSW